MTDIAPYLPLTDRTEYVAWLRGLRALVLVFVGPNAPVLTALAAAERDPAAVAAVGRALARIPPLTARRILSVWRRVLDLPPSDPGARVASPSPGRSTLTQGVTL